MGKGNPNMKKGAPPVNPKGRPVGSKNKTTEEIRKAYQEIVSSNLEKLQEDLDSMSPQARWNILTGLQKTFLPSLTKAEIEGAVNGDINIKVEFVEKDKE